ncbi:MAG: FixH family protein, partial [Flavobacteriales bacterium]
MKFSWGKAIFLVMTAFVLLMASFMYRAAFNQEELVAENYYEQEIKYQEQIDKLNRAGALGEAVRMEVVGNELVISFPQEVQGRALS